MGKKSLFKIAWNYRKIIIITVIIVTTISIVISLILPVWYKATAVIMPPSDQLSPLGGLGALAGGMNLGSVFGENAGQKRLLTILKSRSIKEKIARKYNLQKRYDCENMELTLEKLDENITIVLGEELQIKISLYDQDPDMVAKMTNYMVHCLDSMNITLTNREGSNVRQFVEDRMRLVIDSLKQIEAELKTFMEREGIISLEDQVRAGVINAAQIQSEIIKKEIELEVAQYSLEKNNPKIKLIQLELNKLKNEYNNFFKDVPAQKLFLDFDEIPELGIRLEQASRKVAYYEKILEFLGPQYEKAKIDETRNIPTIQVIDEAVRPEKKSKPRRSVIVISFFLLSLIGSVYFVYFKEKLGQ